MVQPVDQIAAMPVTTVVSSPADVMTERARAGRAVAYDAFISYRSSLQPWSEPSRHGTRSCRSPAARERGNGAPGDSGCAENRCALDAAKASHEGRPGSIAFRWWT